MAGSDGPTYILVSARVRANCCEAIVHAPNGSRVTIRPPKRTLEQNAKLHAMLRDIVNQHPVEFGGRELSLDDWKAAMMQSLGHNIRWIPSPFDGGVVAVPPRTSKMSVDQCAEAIEALYAKGAEWGIKWSEPELWHNPAPIGEVE